jgi:predicted nuclease of predicted toxin-antitoxin system
VKFLVDNQLPTALARRLSAQGLECRHVLDLGLDEADDATIWQQVVAEGFVLISKDEDFLHLANRSNANAQFIWVRLGNCRKQTLLTAFDALLPQLIVALETGARVVEVR